MSIKKLFTINLLSIIFLLLIGFIYEKAFKSPLIKDTEITKGYEFEDELDVFISGKYSLSLTFFRLNRKDTELLNFFGDYFCWHPKRSTPCTNFKDYEISWVFTSDEGNEIKGQATPYIRQGRSKGQRWSEGIGIPVLKSGHYNLKVKFNSDFSELSYLSPQLKLSQGGSGSKTVASTLHSYISIVYVLSTVVLYPLIAIIFILIIFKTITSQLSRTKNSWL